MATTSGLGDEPCGRVRRLKFADRLQQTKEPNRHEHDDGCRDDVNHMAQASADFPRRILTARVGGAVRVPLIKIYEVPEDEHE